MKGAARPAGSFLAGVAGQPRTPNPKPGSCRIIATMHPRTRELLDYLDQQRAELRARFDAIPPALRDRSPAPGCWSAAGVIEHLAIVENRVCERVKATVAEACAAAPELATGRGSNHADAAPIVPTLDLGRLVDRSTRITATASVAPTGLTPDLAWSSLTRAGEAVRALLVANDTVALGSVMLQHPLLGERSAYYYFAFVGAHEARHADQLKEIAAAFATA